MSDYDFRAVIALFSTRGGIASRRELTALGVPPSTVVDWVTRGLLEPVGARVLRLGPPGDSELARLWSAVLAVGQASVLSHHTSIRRWGLWGSDPGVDVHVLTPTRAKHRPTGVIVHHTRRLLAREHTLLDGLPVATPARAICDVAGGIRPTTVVDLVADAMSRQLVRLDDLERCVEARRRFPGRAAVRAALETLDDQDARYLSKLERTSAMAIRRAGLPSPRINYPIRLAGQARLLDHAWPEVRYCVEIDGPHHLRPSQREDDERRDEALRRAGWAVDRFTPEVVARAAHVGLIAARLVARTRDPRLALSADHEMP